MATEEQVRAAGHWLVDKKIPALSIEQGTVLVQIIDALNKQAPSLTDAALSELLDQYRGALKTVAMFSAIHQKAMIEKLERLKDMGGPGRSDLN